MSPEAIKILQVLKVKGTGENNFVGFSDFGVAIVWEAGSVKDEAVRQAITYHAEGLYR